MNERAAEGGGLPDDRGTGLLLFVVFAVACLTVTGAVAMLALMDTWWVLGFAFGIDLVMTVVVWFTVLNALDSGAVWPTARARSDGDQDLELPAGAPIEAGRAHPAAA